MIYGNCPIKWARNEKKRIFKIQRRIQQGAMNALRFDNIGGIRMVTVKRQRKRSLVNPRGRQVIVALSALLALALVAGAIALVALVRLNGRMEDLNGYIAKSIRTDINQAIQCYDTLERRGDDAAADALGSMKRYMYSAYGMNRLLVEARGEQYALLDASAYNSFQTAVGEYERLLANGQATGTTRATLGDCVKSLRTMLAARFDESDNLLPQ